MRLARWKVMAGGLMLSAGGLMAVAEGPTPVPGCQPAPICLPALPAPTSPAVTRVSLEAPVAVPAPKVVDLPLPAPAAPSQPKIDLPSAPASTLPALPMRPPVVGTDTTLPGPVQTASSPLQTAPPVAKPEEAPPAPLVGPVLSGFEPIAPQTTNPAERAAVYAATPAPAVPAEKPIAAPEPKKPEPAATPTVGEKRLKVVLHMGDDRPRFEVRDGEETYLKVVSDRVEVKSAAGNEVPTMKAGGKVAFVTPGGDGTCDELTILPGSGQVVAAGNVAFRHTWGRSETTVTSERMTFRLANPGPTAIQAGYTPVR